MGEILQKSAQLGLIFTNFLPWFARAVGRITLWHRQYDLLSQPLKDWLIKPPIFLFLRQHLGDKEKIGGFCSCIQYININRLAMKSRRYGFSCLSLITENT